MAYLIIIKKDGIEIFNLFKRTNASQNPSNNNEQQDPKVQTRLVLGEAKKSLKQIESSMIRIKGKHLFSNLILFLSYYSFIIEFYTKNIDSIISVKELLLLKYIDMINGILLNFDESISSKNQKEELLNALKTVNEKLFMTIKNIKEQGEMNLTVDLKTLRDLVQTDF